MSARVDALYRRLLTQVAGRRAWRRAVLFAAVLVRETLRDQVHVRAATLAYWSLVTIVPVLIVTVAVLAPLTPPGSVPFHELILSTMLASPVQNVGASVSQWLNEIDLARLGVIGTIGVAFAGSRIYFQVEDAYNVLWNTRPRRSWLTRLVLFYTTVTLGPLLLTAGFQLSDTFEASVGTTALHWVAPATLTTVAFVAGIKALPDAAVRWSPALIGGFASGVAFELAKAGFGIYTRLLGAEDKAAQIYGSLGLFPVFLLWLFLLWVIVLMGVELAYVVQRQGDLIAAEERRIGGDAEARRHPDALFALQCLIVVADRFVAGKGPAPEPDVSHALASDPAYVRAALETLEAAGVLAETPNGYLPALPLSLLTVRDVLLRYREHTRPGMARGAPGEDVVAELLGEGAPRLDTSLLDLTTRAVH